MNRRHYLRILSTMFATTALGGCTVVNTGDGKPTPQHPDNHYGEDFDIPPMPNEESHCFFLVSDLGRNGYYQQKPIAEMMGLLAEKTGPEFIITAGDTHHFNGVASVNDPLWMTNYELIYSHPELMIEWQAINGNHEYRGNTQAVLDYGKVSRRWIIPSRYYSKVEEAGDNESILIVFIDTTPLIDRYRENPETYPDAIKQDVDAQLRWIDETLAASQEKWKIVVGHHPVFADTDKLESERLDMQKRVMPLLEKHGVDMYFCGHIHNFQHIKPAGGKVDYVVNSAASLARPVNPIEDTVFCSPDEGFTFIVASDKELTFDFINGKGEIIYSYTKKK